MDRKIALIMLSTSEKKRSLNTNVRLQYVTGGAI